MAISLTLQCEQAVYSTCMTHIHQLPETQTAHLLNSKKRIRGNSIHFTITLIGTIASIVLSPISNTLPGQQVETCYRISKPISRKWREISCLFSSCWTDVGRRWAADNTRQITAQCTLPCTLGFCVWQTVKAL